MKCVIFDLDGTLLYTLEDLYIATNYALEQVGRDKRSLDEVRNFVGNGVAKLIERAMGENSSQEEIQKCLEIFKEYYSKNAQKNTRPYDGIIELLKYLKKSGIKIALNSNKYDAAVKSLSHKYFDDLVEIALGESNNCPKKPDPTGVEKILKYFNCNKDSAIYIGDSLVDIQTAKNAKIPCISVSWGYCNKDRLLLNNKIVVDNTQELKQAIEKTLQIDKQNQ